MIIDQMPLFKKAYKKLHRVQKKKVGDAIRLIIEYPEKGQEKKGDLAGVRVHKFKINTQEFLLAYEYSAERILLLAIGSHENFYRDLKR